MVHVIFSLLLCRELCRPQESAMLFCVLIYHCFVGAGVYFRDSLNSAFLIEICTHTFHLSIAYKLAFRTLCTGFNDIYRSEPKLAINAFHPLSIWTLLFELHVALSVWPLSEMHLGIIPRDDLKDILLSDVRYYKLSFHIFGCCLSGSFPAFLSPVLFPSGFAPIFGHIIRFIGTLLRLIVSNGLILANKLFPVLPSLFLLNFGLLLLFLNLFQILPWLISSETCLFLGVINLLFSRCYILTSLLVYRSNGINILFPL